MSKTFLIFLFVSLFFNYSNAGVISLKQALKANKIAIDISPKEDGTHYHSPFILEVRNLTAQKLNVSLENGMTLVPDDESYQEFIITETQLLALQPRSTEKRRLMAMCIQESNSAPREAVKYQIGEKANEGLCKLSKFIEENKQFEPDAQFLMWEIASGYIKNDEIDSIEMNEFGSITIMDLDASGNLVIVEKEALKEEPKLKQLIVEGSFTMNLSRNHNIHIAMFNMENVIVKELYNNPSSPTGNTKLKYEFDSLEFPEEKYQIKLVMNGDVVMKRVVTMDLY